MESKIIKVKTNGDILRDAGIISGFSLDGSEYVVYYIERDSDMDNIFTSKLIKNTDGTYNMLNIDSVNEKTNIISIVKQMVKHAVDDTADSLNGNNLTLSDGKNIKLFSLIINKEQSIDIEKTYLTTVKKAVIEVAKKYYILEDNNASLVSEPVIEPVTVSNTVPVTNVEVVNELPVMSEPVELLKEETITEKVVNSVPTTEVELPNLEDLNTTNNTSSIDEEVKNVVPELFSEPVVNTEPIVLLQPEVPTAENTILPMEDKVNEVSVVEPVLVSNNQTVTSPVVEVSNNVSEAINSPVNSTVNPIVTPVEEKPVNNIDFFALPVENSNVVNEVSQTVSVVNEAPSAPVVDNRLVLDGSHETNLNKVLGEVSESIPVSDIQAVKDFGIDEVVNNNPTAQVTTPIGQPVNNNGNKAGFANSKFFMFVAIGFFLASCIFLGYEAFKYFQLVK